VDALLVEGHEALFEADEVELAVDEVLDVVHLEVRGGPDGDGAAEGAQLAGPEEDDEGDGRLEAEDEHRPPPGEGQEVATGCATGGPASNGCVCCCHLTTLD
jgi:hypothetical protein